MLEDLIVGERIETVSLELSAEAICEFAAQYDPQFMHTDAEAARDGFFGELVASGWHTAVLTMRLMVQARPLGAEPMIGVQVDAMRFRRPVAPGAVLRAVGEITGTGPSRVPGYGRVFYDITTFDGDEIVMTQKWTVLARRRSD